MKVHAWLFAVGLLAVVAVAQPKPTQAQMVGKWVGSLELIESKIPKNAPKDQIVAARKRAAGVKFAFDFKSDSKFELNVDINAKDKDHIKGKWRVQGNRLYTTDEWRNGKAVPKANQKEDKFTISTFDGKVLTGAEEGMGIVQLRLTKK